MGKKNVTANRDPDGLAEERTPEQIEALAKLMAMAEEQGGETFGFRCASRQSGFLAGRRKHR